MTNPYLLAQYQIDIFERPILIGQICAELESYMEMIQAQSWVFITAYNPMSIVYPDDVNVNRNLILQEQIQTYKYLEGEGRDPAGEWKPERSFCVFDMDLGQATELAKKHNQKAIVFGSKRQPAQLIMIQD